MPVNHSYTNHVITVLVHSAKLHLQNIFITLVPHVDNDMTKSLISSHKQHDLNVANFYIKANENVHNKQKKIK